MSLSQRDPDQIEKDLNEKVDVEISYNTFEEEKKQDSDEEIKIEQIFIDKYMMKEHV